MNMIDDAENEIGRVDRHVDSYSARIKNVEKKNGAGKIGIADLSRVQNSLDNQPACLLLYRSFKRPATMPR
jgi:hypothetical protein